MPEQLSKEKISHTILEFGRPLIIGVPEERELLEPALKLVISVWNAVVLDQWHNNTNYVDKLLETVEEMPRDAQLSVKRLIKRKHKHFAKDLRGVGYHKLKFKNGEFVLRCDARAQPKPETTQ